MLLRRPASSGSRRLLAPLLLGSLIALSGGMPAQATLLPEGFFEMQVSAGEGATAVEADLLTYNASTDVISAQGNVILSYQGLVIRADQVDFNQQTGELVAIGNVAIRDELGNVCLLYTSDAADE